VTVAIDTDDRAALLQWGFEFDYHRWYTK